MNILNEAELIRNLKSRYLMKSSNIFTYIGPTLIVINPYKQLTDLFSQQTLDNIKRNLQQNIQAFSLDLQPPHVYAVSATAFKNLIMTGKKQAIVISGETGAGLINVLTFFLFNSLPICLLVS